MAMCNRSAGHNLLRQNRKSFLVKAGAGQMHNRGAPAARTAIDGSQAG